MSIAPACPWCGRTYRPRRTGGQAQRFCGTSCRRALHSAARTWALDAIASSVLTIADIRSVARATCALPTGVDSGQPAPRQAGDRARSPVRVVASEPPECEFERMLPEVLDAEV
jgi:hypothetical protein